MQDSRTDTVQIPQSLLCALLADLDSCIEFVHAHDQADVHGASIALPSAWFQGLMPRDYSFSPERTVELYSQDVQKLLKSSRDVIRGLDRERWRVMERADLTMGHSIAGRAEEDEDEVKARGERIGVRGQTRTSDVDGEEEQEEDDDMYDFDADHGY